MALVTGGATGLGREICLLLGYRGMHVAVNYSHSHDDAEATVADLRALGVQSAAFHADVGRPEDVQHLVTAVFEQFGRIDVLVSNAGTTIFRPFQDLDGVSEDDWDRIMDVNVKATWRLAKALAPIMKRGGFGHIVTISSIAGLNASGSSLPYSVSKAALIQLTRGLAVALAPEIRVNTVAPGLMETRWVRGLGASTIDNLVAASPLRMASSVADAAHQVLNFIESTSVTGSVAVVDAGSTI